MEKVGIGISAVSGIVMLIGTFRFFFCDSDEFYRCIKFWLKPDIFSMFNGEYFEDSWAEFKLGAWGAVGIGTGAVVFHFFMKYMS